MISPSSWWRGCRRRRGWKPRREKRGRRLTFTCKYRYGANQPNQLLLGMQMLLLIGGLICPLGVPDQMVTSGHVGIGLKFRALELDL